MNHELPPENIDDKELKEKEIFKKMKEKYGIPLGEGWEDKIRNKIKEAIELFGDAENFKGKRILDIGCGHVLTAEQRDLVRKNEHTLSRDFYEKLKQLGISDSVADIRAWEPWLCRILLEFGANPVGIDVGNLEGEEFEHYNVDMTKLDALGFLPEKSFDAINMNAFLDSPQLKQMLGEPGYKNKRLKEKLKNEIIRLLKDGGKLFGHNLNKNELFPDEYLWHEEEFR